MRGANDMAEYGMLYALYTLVERRRKEWFRDRETFAKEREQSGRRRRNVVTTVWETLKHQAQKE